MKLLSEDINRIKQIMRLIVESEDKVVCDECKWSWKLSEGGDDPYTCHKCGHTNEVNNGEIGEQEDAGGGTAPSSPAMNKWETGITRGPANPVAVGKWSDTYQPARGKGNPLW